MTKNLVIKNFPSWEHEDNLVKVIGDGPKNADGVVATTLIRVLPTPFGSPSKKDLHNQYFIAPEGDNPGTVFGDDMYLAKGLPVIKPGLYEHGMNGFNNPEFAKFGKMANLLGPATLVKQEGDPNRWFEIEVQRSLQYHDLLVDLIDLKVMGASTQAFMNNVDVQDDGGITYWLENEVGPTVNPANSDTIKQMNDLYQKNKPKYISLPPMSVKMWKSGDVTEDVIIGEVQTAETPEEEPSSIDAEIAEIFGDEIPEEAPALTPEAIAELEKMLGGSLEEIKEHTKFMSVFIELWGGDYEEIKQNLTDLISGTKTVKAIEKQLADQMKLLKALSLFVKNSRISDAAEKFNSMTQLEREILEEQEEEQRKSFRRTGSPIPHGAPGTY